MSPWTNFFQTFSSKQKLHNKSNSYQQLRLESLEVRTLLAGDLIAAGSYEDVAEATSIGTTNSANIIQSLIDSGAIASSPSPGLPTPGDFQGNPLQPIVTDTFSQAVPSNDWWSSVHFAEYGDAFSAPLFIHPITAKATETGISLSAQTIQSAFETGPTLREFQVAFVPDVHIDLFGSGAASEFALDSYSDWAFTGKWKGIEDTPSATMAQGSPMVWIEAANFSSTNIRWDDGGANVTVNGDTVILTVADRTYGLYAPTGSAWQISGQSASLTGNGSGNIAIALLPGTEAGTLTAFRQAANQPITGTSFTYGRGEDPYSLTLNYDYSLSGNGNGETVVALYPHLARQTSTEDLPSADYSSARGNMPTVQTSSIQANVKSRGVLPALPSTLDSQQIETLRQLLLTDEAATNPSGYFSRFADPYWSGKSMLKLMQLSQVAEVVGESAVRDQIHEAVKAGLADWFDFNGNPNDRHFAYNAQWDTLQGYPDAFYSGQMLNDHHFHMGYLVHAAALVGMQDPAWAAENQTVIDLIIKDVAGTDAADTMLPRLRNFSPMAGHSWASGHGAFSRGNNHESSSEAMNFATGLMLWGEVTGQQDTTLLGQTLYSLEAEAIAEYWFDKYGTTYPEEFDVESVGMVWGDGATHATWFSAEVEMIRAINFLPFHGGSLYLSEMARDGEALIDDIERLNGGPPDVWQSLISQYEVMVSPEEAWDKFSLQENQPEEGQSAAFTYYWMATLANLGTPTSDIRGDHPLSAVFQNDDANTYTAHNAGSEPITVTFNDGVSFNVAPGTTRTVTGSEGEPVDPPQNPPGIDPPDDPPVTQPAFIQVIDNNDTGFTQSGFKLLTNPQVAAAVGGDVYQLRRGSGVANWTFNNLEDGEYRVATTWRGKYGNRYNATDAPYTLSDESGNLLAAVTVDQTSSPSEFEFEGVMWNELATVSVTGGTLTVSLSEGANANRTVIADAVRIERTDGSPAPPANPPQAPPPADPAEPPIDDQPADLPVETPGAGLIIDNGDSGFTQLGFSYLSNAQSVTALDGDIHQLRGGSGTASWNFENLEPGQYRVATTWAGKYENRYNATDAAYAVFDGNDNLLSAVTVDQTAFPADFEDEGVFWHQLSTVSITGDSLTVTLREGSNPNRYAVADAVRIERVTVDEPADPPQEDPAEPPTAPLDPPAESQIDFSIDWPGPDVYMVVGRTNALYGYVDDVSIVSAMQATIQNVETGLYVRPDDTLGSEAAFDVLLNTNNGHWSLLHTPLAGGTYALSVTAIGNDGDTVTRTTNFNVQGAVPVPPVEAPTEPPAETPADPPYDAPVDPPSDPPMDMPMDPPYAPPAAPPTEEVTYGFGLLEPGGPDAYATTGFNQGEFLSNINFSHRATADPLVAPGNPNFWHAHDFFVNPSTDAFSTIESLMAVDGSSALPANNESVYWVPSMINETTGEYVTPLDSSIAYYRITRPFDPGKLEAMPTGLSVIAGAAMPSERQSVGVVAWNYIGTSERYDHLPIGDEWQDLPLQALIYFPMFWDGENLDSANHKSHMAYADAAGGPSTHPHLLPQLELQIHYGRIPQDAQLMLTSDYMTQDHPDFAPGWSMHADHIHLPWPEFDDNGNLYDGFERRVTDSMRFPIFAGTDGNSVRTITTGAEQPFTPEPFYTYPVFPGQDQSAQPDTTAPILVAASPAGNSTDAPVNADIVLVFDEPVVAGSGMIHLMTGPTDDPLTAPTESHESVEMFAATDPRVQIEGNRVRISLQNTLDYDTAYHLDIGSNGDAFVDLSGNGYQRAHADYNFTTTDGVGVDFVIDWPGSETWMGVGNTGNIYGQVSDVDDLNRMSATIQNVETGLYQQRDGTFAATADAFDISINEYDGHWYFAHTPSAGGTYRLEVVAVDSAQNVTRRTTNFGVVGDPPSGPGTTDPQDPDSLDGPLTLSVGGNTWTGGLTARLTITNTSDTPVSDWTFTFTSPHTIDSAWGMQATLLASEGGTNTYRAVGDEWGRAIEPGDSVTVGFTAEQGMPIGADEPLTAAQLFTSVSQISIVEDASPPAEPPADEPAEPPADEPIVPPYTPPSTPAPPVTPPVTPPADPPASDPIIDPPPAQDDAGDAIFNANFDNRSRGPYTEAMLDEDWNTPAWSQGVDDGRVSLIQTVGGNTALAVSYPAGSYGTNNTGAQWKLDFDAGDTELRLSYDIQFAEGFDFVKGGKLPGFFGGAGNTGGGIPTGTDGFSARMMWREGGQIVQYMYYPDQPEYYGEDMPWTDATTGEPLRFTPGAWQNVTHELHLNTAGQSDGWIRTYLDGQLALERTDLRFRDTDAFAIDGVYFSTFFGGGSDSWSTTQDETIYFDNFSVTSLSSEQAPPVSAPTLELVADTTGVQLLVDPATGLAYVQDGTGDPIAITRNDNYWSGNVPLTRESATLQAAARDAAGRLRVLDTSEWGAFAWILDESGAFIGEESQSDTSEAAKESLFQFDINGDGVIGPAEAAPPAAPPSAPPFAPPADPDAGADVLADGVRVRMMSFNVFYASLGAPERIDGIAQAIADYTPDVASIQEMWGEKDQILAAIEAKTGLDYAFSTGSNTWDGDILYRADRWRVLNDGVVTYDGSRGMTYATLEHLRTGERMSVYGMHPLSAVSEEVHLRNIEMATEHMAASPYAGEAPVVLLGDMNATENSESMRLIRDGSLNAFGQNWTAPITFEDTFRVANGAAADGNTGFGVKIDYVFVEERDDGPFRVEGASIRNDAPGGSDHFPVMAEVVLLF